MQLPGDHDNQWNVGMVMTVVTVSLFVGVILIAVLLLNSDAQKTPKKAVERVISSVPQVIEDGKQQRVENGVLHPDDLDFWDKYPVATAEPLPTSTPESTDTPVENDPSKDGRHTLVTNRDGSEDWLLISPYLAKNEYDYTKLVCQSDLMKYYEDSKLISYVGIDISKFQDYVDFVKIKKAGIQYVMLRAGARGYGTGQIIEDDYFQDNLKRATDAGLYVGVYFYSQAITEEEAVEEAEFVLSLLGEYKIEYPIAYDMEFVSGDQARIEALSKAEKTSVAKCFLEKIAGAGYKGILYGNKEWLLKEIDISKLGEYDVWLSQQKDIPDYPYRFSMWQYSTQGTIDGVAGPVNLNISFVNFAEK